MIFPTEARCTVTAHHEAGHAVAHLRTGRPFDHVWANLAGDGLVRCSQKHRCDLQTLLLGSLSGGAAGDRRLFEVVPAAVGARFVVEDSGDEGHLARALGMTIPELLASDTYRDGCRLATHFVAVHWPAIQRVAAELERRALAAPDGVGRLDAAEVRAIVEPGVAESRRQAAALIGLAKIFRTESTTGDPLARAHRISRAVLETSWDYTTRKYWDLITVEDVNSIAGIQDTRTVKLKHPGIRTDGSTPPLRQLLRSVMAGRSEKALPWWTTSVSLASWLFRRVAVGDIVRFASTTIPDPYGSGERDCDCLGIVIDLTWNYRARSGRASLLLYSRFSADSVAPWAASALVDKSAANGGWDAANRRLTLLPLAFGQVGDQDDGARFAAGDYVYLIERAAADSTAPTVLGGPVQVNKAYEADGANLLTLDPAAVFAAWDADKEWFVVPADYDEVATAQKTTNAYQADATTRLIDGDAPHRWG
jgi:hypothetical protein